MKALNCNFSLKHYSIILSKAKRWGYKVMPLLDYWKQPPHGKVLVLRHDVDFNPERALAIARVEKRLGVRSTFFVRVHFDGYNPFGFKTNSVLREIKALGHEVGLHYEANDYAAITRDALASVLLREKVVLENALGFNVEGCSAHGDFSGVSNKTVFSKLNPRELGFEYEAWEPPFQSLFFVSDSLGKWSSGECLCKLIGKHERIYASTHPNYWFNEFYHLS